jgi:hypothetical protein
VVPAEAAGVVAAGGAAAGVDVESLFLSLPQAAATVTKARRTTRNLRPLH